MASLMFQTSAFVASYCGAKVANTLMGLLLEKVEVPTFEEAGLTLSLKPEEIAQCIEEVGIGYHTPSHHSAMKHLSVEEEIGQKSIFNILGPLTNPASAKRKHGRL